MIIKYFVLRNHLFPVFLQARIKPDKKKVYFTKKLLFTINASKYALKLVES